MAKVHKLRKTLDENAITTQWRQDNQGNWVVHAYFRVYSHDTPSDTNTLTLEYVGKFRPRRSYGIGRARICIGQPTAYIVGVSANNLTRDGPRGKAYEKIVKSVLSKEPVQENPPTP